MISIREFWVASRKAPSGRLLAGVIQQYTALAEDISGFGRARELGSLRIPCYCRATSWPGGGSRDDEATVDVDFHEQDDKLLRALGSHWRRPHGGCDLSSEAAYVSFRSSYRRPVLQTRQPAAQSVSELPELYVLRGCGSSGRTHSPF